MFSNNVNWIKQESQKCQEHQVCHRQMCYFKLQMHQNSFSAGAPPRGPRWGSLRRSHIPYIRLGTLPRPLGRGTLPIPSPSISGPMAPRFIGPLREKFLATPMIVSWLCSLLFVVNIVMFWQWRVEFRNPGLFSTYNNYFRWPYDKLRWEIGRWRIKRPPLNGEISRISR